MKQKIEFTVKIEVETDFNLSNETFVEIPIFCMKLCHSHSINPNTGNLNYVPAKFLSCKTTEIKIID